jgi:hypothetical protein
MNRKTTMKLMAIAQVVSTVDRAVAGNLVPLLNDVIWNQFPRERKEGKI